MSRHGRQSRRISCRGESYSHPTQLFGRERIEEMDFPHHAGKSFLAGRAGRRWRRQRFASAGFRNHGPYGLPVSAFIDEQGLAQQYVKAAVLIEARFATSWVI